MTPLEILLRLREPKAYEVWAAGLHTELYPEPGNLPGIEGRKEFSINSLGIRGEEPPKDGTFRILALGSSTTESLYFDDSEVWTKLVEDKLNASSRHRVWVGNVGRAGHGTRENMVQVRRLLAQPPAMDAIVLLPGATDFLDYLAHAPHYERMTPVEILRSAAVERRAFMRIPPKADGSWVRGTAIGRRFWVHTYTEPIGLHFEQDSFARIYPQLRALRHQARIFRRKLPDLDPPLHEFRDNLSWIIAWASQHRVRVVLMTQPYLWHASMPASERSMLWMGRVDTAPKAKGRREYYSASAMAAGISRFNAVTMQLCHETKAKCIDLAKLVPQRALNFCDDLHFSEVGNRLAASVIAGRLSKRVSLIRER